MITDIKTEQEIAEENPVQPGGRINIYQPRQRAWLDRQSDEQIRALADRGSMSKVDAEWVIWFRGQPREVKAKLRKDRVQGPSAEMDFFISQKSDTEKAMANAHKVSDAKEEASPVSEVAGVASLIIAQLVRPGEKTPYGFLRRCVALVHHMRPGEVKGWGGLRKQVLLLNCCYAALHNDVLAWERLLGGRAATQRSDRYRAGCTGSKPGTRKPKVKPAKPVLLEQPALF